MKLPSIHEGSLRLPLCVVIIHKLNNSHDECTSAMVKLYERTSSAIFIRLLDSLKFPNVRFKMNCTGIDVKLGKPHDIVRMLSSILTVISDGGSGISEN